MPAARSVLRSLLRSIDKHITSASGNRQWRDHVVASFRDGKPSNGALADEQLQVSQDLAMLINNVAHHQVYRQLCLYQQPRDYEVGQSTHPIHHQQINGL